MTMPLASSRKSWCHTSAAQSFQHTYSTQIHNPSQELTARPPNTFHVSRCYCGLVVGKVNRESERTTRGIHKAAIGSSVIRFVGNVQPVRIYHVGFGLAVNVCCGRLVWCSVRLGGWVPDKSIPRTRTPVVHTRNTPVSDDVMLWYLHSHEWDIYYAHLCTPQQHGKQRRRLVI